MIRRWRGKKWLALLLILAVAAGGVALRVRSNRARPGSSPTISKETTYITEPLRSDGCPDYVAALNRLASQGVTPENNAAVPFWRAMGPGVINERNRDRHFQMLGMPRLPDKGDYFVDLGAFLARRWDSTLPADSKQDPEIWFNTWEQLGPVLKRPWSKQEFPTFAEWLAANEKPLGLLVEASKRPRRYDPLVCGPKTPIIATLTPAVEQYRSAGRALAARAMLRLKRAESDAAWDDLLACHRLARLAAQGPTPLEAVRANDELGCVGDLAIVQYAGLSAEEIARMRDDLGRLPPLPTMVGAIDVGERFTYLDAAVKAAQERPATAASRAANHARLKSFGMDDARGAVFEQMLNAAGDPQVDWNVALRMGNEWFDRVVAAARKPTHGERMRAAENANEELDRLLKSVSKGTLPAQWMPADAREFRSRLVGAACLVSYAVGPSSYVNIDDQRAMRFELTKLAFALAAYRADHGSYPAALAELVPQYVAELPKDIFNNDSDLHYARQGDGYLLYSVGRNGRDDGGKGVDDRKKGESWEEIRKKGEDWDDLAIRVSAKP